jgi:FtsH-binding integral membrane protein
MYLLFKKTVIYIAFIQISQNSHAGGHVDYTVETTGTEDAMAETKRFFVKVYGWMSLALTLTGLVAIWIASQPAMINLIFGNSWVFLGLLIAEFVLVAYLTLWVKKMAVETATIVFLLYSLLNGVTFSCIFLIYTTNSIASTFFVTAGTFAVMSVYGYVTKSDLSKLGNLLLMGLFGIIAASFINIYYQNSTLDWIITYSGVVIFVGLIAYDTQKLKNYNSIGNEGTDEDKKEAIIGALSLYLDFINLFLMLLRLMGRKR